MHNSSISNIRKKFIDFFAKHDHKIFPSSSLMTKDDPSLLFTNAGMVPFKKLFTSIQDVDVKMAASSQKCLRVGGKHNDFENVGHTNRHHTFFEMLGNFSFGGYFKEKAIELAWKFITQELCLEKDRLYFTVYHSDDEAFKCWKKVSGCSDDRIIKISTSDNFWSMGNVGPCGPCSEIFYDYGDDIEGGLPGTCNEGNGRFTEIWNLVFMQYNRDDNSDDLHILPRKCIDTGMGLERITAVMQGVKDNYDIDMFKALIEASKEYSDNSTNQLAHRVIADHVRSAAFLISEGITPGNDGRSYILRRIIRRAARYAYQLGCKDALMHKVVPIILDKNSAGYMGDVYPELIRAQDLIISVLKLEEEGFFDTLRRGLLLLTKEISFLSPGDTLSGDIAFKLYDTYGFPLDITLDVVREKKLKFDQEGFYHNMQIQKNRSREYWLNSENESVGNVWFELLNKYKETKFVGYDTLGSSASVLAIVCDNYMMKSIDKDKAIDVLLNNTPFYAEAGGQQGDRGVLTVTLRNGSDLSLQYSVIEVLDTKKVLNSLHVHKCVVRNGILSVGDIVYAEVDGKRRKKLQSNHSATHLLHYALKLIIDQCVIQKGSLVTAEKLRFDFNCSSALTREQIDLVEDKVNDLIRENYSTIIDFSTFDDANAKGAVALFGEKYNNDNVRIVSIGDSKELCCGTHVRYTGEIGLFKIVSESSIAFGVRRIEAVTGQAAIDYLRDRDEILCKISDYLCIPFNQVIGQIEKLSQEKQKITKTLYKTYCHIIEQQLKTLVLGNNKLCYAIFNNIPVDIIKKFVVGIKSTNLIVAVSTKINNKALFVISVGEDLKDKLSALKFLTIFNTFNGKGGGNAHLLQASIDIGYTEEAMLMIQNEISKILIDNA
ncbi:alanine--tRNA ligase [Candidatus Neoehrlichia procyonis]|uniref:Alanine--tRNA ligase n=1 Tax=Candidatus Neoehrlichia procyonis str. RAC413 TaxID=1359163 RepID=A0A0F3NPA8_9RICK|nr:alanine--tRNA ligase [Candidatus Neoehrlichia lotoris]KJV69542.1 alanine--tRNA ligase [Candidatus Neoehrlichia lotoris str. RAC413]